MKNGPYTLVFAPPEWPGKRYRGKYCYEHHLVFWQATGHIILAEENIHHVNGDKRDNRIENLELKTVFEHKSLHAKKASLITLTCDFCGCAFEIPCSVYRGRLKMQDAFCCSRSCQVKKQWRDGTSGLLRRMR
jgi:hypothetical protein